MRDDPVRQSRRRIALALSVACLTLLAPGSARVLVAQQTPSVAPSADQIQEWLRSAEQLLLEQRGAQAVVLFERARRQRRAAWPRGATGAGAQRDW